MAGRLPKVPNQRPGAIVFNPEIFQILCQRWKKTNVNILDSSFNSRLNRFVRTRDPLVLALETFLWKVSSWYSLSTLVRTLLVFILPQNMPKKLSNTAWMFSGLPVRVYLAVSASVYKIESPLCFACGSS